MASQAAGLIDREGLAAGAGVLMLALTPLSLPWWRAVGEPAREAHKSAFYWGGLIAWPSPDTWR